MRGAVLYGPRDVRFKERDDDHASRVPLRLGECHVGGRDHERCVLIDKNWPHACERLRPLITA